MPIVAAARSGGGHPVWHLVLPAVLSVGVFVGLKVWEHWHRRVTRRWERPSPPVVALALASAGAAAVHGAACPAHFREATVFGPFFVGAAALQAAWACLIVVRPGRTLLIVGAAGNSAVVALWTLSRTVGVPIGPDVWTPEAVAAADSLATTLELAIIIGVLWVLFHRQLTCSRPLPSWPA